MPFEVNNFNRGLANVWNCDNLPTGEEWHKGLVVSYLTNETGGFLQEDLVSLQNETDWHRLPLDGNNLRRYYPCFYTRLMGRNKIFFL